MLCGKDSDNKSPLFKIEDGIKEIVGRHGCYPWKNERNREDLSHVISCMLVNDFVACYHQSRSLVW